MPDISTLAIAAGAWLLLFVLVWSMCVAAGRADAGPRQRMLKTDSAARTAVVVDTGGLRAHLRAGATLIEAEQLTVTADIAGTEVVLASSRAVVEALAGEWPELTAPVRLLDGTVATLRAVRRPGGRSFDATDRALVRALAGRISGTLTVERSSVNANLTSSDALA